MQGGYRDIPHWVMSVVPLLFIAIIVLGGLWFQRLERRAKERAVKPPGDSEGPGG